MVIFFFIKNIDDLIFVLRVSKLVKLLFNFPVFFVLECIFDCSESFVLLQDTVVQFQAFVFNTVLSQIQEFNAHSDHLSTKLELILPNKRRANELQVEGSNLVICNAESFNLEFFDLDQLTQ